MMRFFIITISILLLAGFAFAKDIGGVSLPDNYLVGEEKLILNGFGIRSKFGFTTYVCGLYVKDKTQNWKTIVNADEPMIVRLHFLRDIPYDKVIFVWNESFSIMLNNDQSPYRNQIDKFFTSFKEGPSKDEIWDVIYIPGKGVTVKMTKGVNKYTMGETIPGFDFKKLVFSIWLDPRANDAKLREGLLTGKYGF